MLRVETTVENSTKITYFNGLDKAVLINLLAKTAETHYTPDELATYSIRVVDLGEVAQPKPEPQREVFRKVRLPVTGMRLFGRWKALDRVGLGDMVYVVPEPENEAHRNAQRVENGLGEQIGYLTAEAADKYAEVMGAGKIAKVTKLVHAGRESELEIQIEVPYNL